MKLDLDPQLKTVDSWIKLRILQHKKNSKFLKIFESLNFYIFILVRFTGSRFFSLALPGYSAFLFGYLSAANSIITSQEFKGDPILLHLTYNISWITEVTNTERWKARKIGVKLFLQNTTLGSSENKYCIILTVNQWFESGSGWIRNLFLDPNPGLSKSRSWMRIRKKSFRIHNTALNNT